MASYQHQHSPFYVLPSPAQQQYPLTPNSIQDEFSPLPYFDPTVGGYGGPFGVIGSQGNPGNSSSVSPGSLHRSHSPTLDHSVNVRGGRASSEENELTPGQRRRKEQNRAAQRAFRERKERHVKELELRLESLEEANNRAAVENVQLKTQLEKTQLENRLLHENTMRGHSPSEAPQVGMMSYKPLVASDTSSIGGKPPTLFTSRIFSDHPNRGPIHRISTSPITGERLLGAGAAWDLIVCHPLYEQGLVDISDISDRLKSLARCDGQGPVFEEGVILDAIHASSGSGRDELLVDTEYDF